MGRARPKTKVYDKSKLQAAIRAVLRGKSLSKVSATFGIPKTTLYDHTKERLVNSFKRPGVDPSMTAEKEQTLINYLKFMADKGQPLTKSVLKRFVVGIIRRSGRPTKIDLQKGPSNKWVRNFFKKHPGLKLRRPDRADTGRLQVTQEQVENYFKLLGDTLDSLELNDYPERVYNCDETGFNGHEMGKEKVLVMGKQHPYQQQIFSNVGHITLQFAVNAAGRFIPPMLIFSQSLPRNVQDGLPNDWKLTTSKKGYMDSDLFVQWLEEVFIPNCGRSRPVLLIMDNLGAHMTPRAIDLARDNQIELLCLPAHSTHLLRPLDVRIFHLVKSNLGKVADRLGYQVSKVSRAQMPHLINYSLNMLSALDIQESFRITGIHPFKPSIMNCLKQTLAKQSEIIDASSPNCLVDLGIVPQSLAGILVPPPVKSTKGKRKIPGARLITAVQPIVTDQISSTSTAPDPVPSTSTAHDPLHSVSLVADRKQTFEWPFADTDSITYDEHPNDGICVVCLTDQRLEWVGCDFCPIGFIMRA